MIRLSRYAHVFDLDDAVALYHSLRMKPVYLKKDSYEDLQAWLVSPFCDEYENAPDAIKNEVAELAKYKILNHSEDDDELVLFRADREALPYWGWSRLILLMSTPRTATFARNVSGIL